MVVSMMVVVNGLEVVEVQVTDENIGHCDNDLDSCRCGGGRRCCDDLRSERFDHDYRGGDVNKDKDYDHNIHSAEDNVGAKFHLILLSTDTWCVQCCIRNDSIIHKTKAS